MLEVSYVQNTCSLHFTKGFCWGPRHSCI
jgi:hypothetical protein